MAQQLPPGQSDLIPAVVLAAVPGCESGEAPLAVHVLVGGAGHNDIRRVDTGKGSFVVRRRLPPLVRAGSDALLELACQRLAARHGLAPRVLAAANDASWMVMEFIASSPWHEQDLACAAGVRSVAERLAQVHAIPVAADMRPMDAGSIAVAQLNSIHSKVASEGQRGEAARLARRAIQLAALVQGSEVSRCINHGDLQVANLIGNPPAFIDWEYAQIAPPTYDLACLMTYYPRLQAWQSELLAASGLARPEDLELLGLHKMLFACLNRLWALANGMADGMANAFDAG